MTYEEIDRAIELRLSLHPSPVIEFARLSFICGAPIGTWWGITNGLKKEELPPLFKAGGSQCLFLTEAGPWCRQFVRRDPKRFGIDVEAAA